MISQAELDALMQRALSDKDAEPAFFRALLDATVYAHAPRVAQTGRLRLIQFPLPENGQMVLPFFSDGVQARAAAGSTATVIVLTGRQLFELTRGATLMLNPNGCSCLLYPEEIAALLDHGEIATLDQLELTAPKAMDFREVYPPPTWLTDPLIALYARLPSVEAAYLVEVTAHDDPDPQHFGLLIGLVVPSAEAERAVRATITTVQPLCRIRDKAVDLMEFAPEEVPDWIRKLNPTPFYIRALGQRLAAGSTALQ
jgi:hypothetical protein